MIARGSGTGGHEIATRLTDRLGIHSYANRTLTLASQYSGRGEYDFVEMGECLRDGYPCQQSMSLQKRLTPLPHTNPFESSDRLLEFQKKIIQELVCTEGCVIVGKCADYMLQDFGDTLNVYVEARRVFCMGRVMKTVNVLESEAYDLIAKTNKYRAEYYKYYTDGNYWTNPANYDMALSDGRRSID